MSPHDTQMTNLDIFYRKPVANSSLCKLSLELTGLNFSESLQTVAKVEKK
jgi:hypothetical protein